MPAAAVIPAPIAYTKVVAVKKLVVGFLRGWGAHCFNKRVGQQHPRILPRTTLPLIWWRLGIGSFTLRKFECSKQVTRLEIASME